MSFPIQVPSLRERREDIPRLANHFVNLSVRDLKCAKPRLTRAAVTELQNYDWPGNVRELRNVIERAVILARGGPLSFDLSISGAPASGPRPAVQPQGQHGTNATPKLLTEAELRSLERDNILETLQAAKWRVRVRMARQSCWVSNPQHYAPACRNWASNRRIPLQPYTNTRAC
jgi:DNA-binding NtrC family response regulator